MEGNVSALMNQASVLKNMHIDETNKIMPEFASCIFESPFSLQNPLHAI